jgi:hypothetical protein
MAAGQVQRHEIDALIEQAQATEAARVPDAPEGPLQLGAMKSVQLRTPVVFGQGPFPDAVADEVT